MNHYAMVRNNSSQKRSPAKRYKAGPASAPRQNSQKNKQSQNPMAPKNFSQNSLGSAPSAFASSSFVSRPPFVRSSNGGISAVLSGTERIGTAVVPTVGVIMSYISLNPIMWYNTRTSRLMRLYEKWRIVKMRVHYVPRVPTTATGAVVMSIDYDPADDVPTDINNVMALPRVATSSLFQPCCIDFDPKFKGDQLYRWVDCDDGDAGIRNISEGTIVVACEPGYAPGSTVGSIFVDYVIEVTTPDNPMPLDKICTNHNLYAMTVENGTVDTPVVIQSANAIGTQDVEGIFKAAHTPTDRTAFILGSNLGNVPWWYKIINAAGTMLHIFQDVDSLNNNRPITYASTNAGGSLAWMTPSQVLSTFSPAA